MIRPDRDDARDDTAGNIVLTGFMGTGKTTVGRLLAERLGFEFVDTDHMIEADHGPIPLIFAEQGEAAFRAIESAVAVELAGRGGHVRLRQAQQRQVGLRRLARHEVLEGLVRPRPVQHAHLGRDAGVLQPAHEPPADTRAPQLWLDRQQKKVCFNVAKFHDCEALQFTIDTGNQDHGLAVFNLPPNLCRRPAPVQSMLNLQSRHRGNRLCLGPVRSSKHDRVTHCQLKIGRYAHHHIVCQFAGLVPHG